VSSSWREVNVIIDVSTREERSFIVALPSTTILHASLPSVTVAVARSATEPEAGVISGASSTSSPACVGGCVCVPPRVLLPVKHVQAVVVAGADRVTGAGRQVKGAQREAGVCIRGGWREGVSTQQERGVLLCTNKDGHTCVASGAVGVRLLEHKAQERRKRR
jgi:hypothetical protein